MTVTQVSEVSISNMAMGWLGANLITSLEDGTTEANLCKANFSASRDVVLEARNWSFAIKRASLPVSAPGPSVDLELNPGFSPYQKPSDLIRVIRTSASGQFNDDLDWYIEDETIWVMSSSAVIKYIYRKQDPQKFSAGFVHALAARLAADLAIPITNSRELQALMANLYLAKLESAGAYDGLQGKNQILQSTSLIKVR